MEVDIFNSSNVSTTVSMLKKGGKHFIITVDVPLISGPTIIGDNSILSFRGGSFKAATYAVTIL